MIYGERLRQGLEAGRSCGIHAKRGCGGSPETASILLTSRGGPATLQGLCWFSGGYPRDGATTFQGRGFAMLILLYRR